MIFMYRPNWDDRKHNAIYHQKYLSYVSSVIWPSMSLKPMTEIVKRYFIFAYHFPYFHRMVLNSAQSLYSQYTLPIRMFLLKQNYVTRFGRYTEVVKSENDQFYIELSRVKRATERDSRDFRDDEKFDMADVRRTNKIPL